MFAHIRGNAVAYLALFVALGGTSAYAIDTVGSTDIIDNEVRTADVRDDTLAGGGLNAKDLKAGSVTSSEVLNESLTNADIKNFTLGNGDFLTGSVDSRVVTENSLTGDDIDESTLALPPSTTATFASTGDWTAIGSVTSFAHKNVGAGSWVAVASVLLSNTSGSRTSANCSLIGQEDWGSPAGVMGWGTADVDPGHTTSMTINGGAYFAKSTATIDVTCKGSGLARAQVLIMKVGGFS